MAIVSLYKGDEKFFSSGHLSYAVLVIVVVLFYNVLPLFLLFLSPMRSFQRCLRSCCCSFRCVHFVNTFLEVFQGNFKDRVCHHRDYRFVAGLQFLLRSSILVNYSLVNYPESVCSISIVIFVLWSVAVLMFKPYKRELHNVLEAILSTYYNLCILFSISEGYSTIFNCQHHCFSDSWYTIWSTCFCASAHALWMSHKALQSPANAL